MVCFSDDQRTALHSAAWNGRPQLCQLLIESKADVNAKTSTRCACMFQNLWLICCCIILMLANSPASSGTARPPSNGPSNRTNATLCRCCAALARQNKRFFAPRPCNARHSIAWRCCGCCRWRYDRHHSNNWREIFNTIWKYCCKHSSDNSI